MTPFREQNPIPIAIGGILAIALLLLGSFNLNDLPIPLFGKKTTYQAAFSQAAGLTRENEVRVAGVRVGSVTDVQLDIEQKHVLVTFQIDEGVDLGEETRAAIKLKTLLGTKYMELTPEGSGQLRAGSLIPVGRTSVPFQIYDAVNEFSETLDAIDTEQLAKSFDVLSETFGDSKGNARSALQGLAALSKTIASRDAELQELLAGAQRVTAALAARDTELTKLIADSQLVMEVVLQRRAAISALLRDTSALAKELTSLVRDNRATIDPLLDNLHSVVEVLKKNLTSIDKTVAMLGPFSRFATNATGNGTWLDVYSQNVLFPDTLLCGDLGAC